MADFPDLAGPRDLREGGVVSYGSDDGMIVEFFEDALHMEYLSKQLGYPVYRMQIMTRILQPGNRNTVWVHQTKGITYEMVQDPQSGEYHTSWDVQEVCDNGDVPEPTKYPKQWDKFLKKGVSADTGTPIEQWGTVTKSYAESLKAQNIHTVEQLSQLSDQAAQTIMGARKYRDLALAYLDERQKGIIVAKEQERASRFEEMLKQQQDQFAQLQTAYAQLQAQIQGQAAETGVRHPNQSQVISAGLEGVRKMSTKDAKGKHKIPSAA